MKYTIHYEYLVGELYISIGEVKFVDKEDVEHKYKRDSEYKRLKHHGDVIILNERDVDGRRIKNNVQNRHRGKRC